MENGLADLSVIVCSYNCEEIIRGCLSSVKENNPKEIILVDAGSTDKTVEIAKPFADKIVNDTRKGLGNARNIGLDASVGKYIIFVGADNIMPKGSLIKMIEYFEKYKCATVSAITMLSETNTYLGWAQNIYRVKKYRPGYKDVVGTPTLFLRDTLKKYRYDVFMTNSDDTDLCTRMSKDGHKFAISDAICYEKGFASWEAVVDRWIRYGRGDCLYYKKYAKDWSIVRKLKSYRHPFMTDFIVPLKNSGFIKGIAIIPFLILITCLRYYGWLKTTLFFKKRKLTSR